MYRNLIEEADLTPTGDRYYLTNLRTGQLRGLRISEDDYDPKTGMIAGASVMFPAVVVRFNYEEATRLAKSMGILPWPTEEGVEDKGFTQLKALDFVLDRISTILLDSTRIPGSALVLMSEEEIEKQRVLVFNQTLESLDLLEHPTLREKHRDNAISSRLLFVQAHGQSASVNSSTSQQIADLESRVTQLEAVVANLTKYKK